MKLYSYILLGALVLSGTACEDYLDVYSDSSVDEDFVFSSVDETYKVVSGCYDILRSTSNIHSNGMFYNIAAVGSDSERHPEAYDAQTRHKPEGLNPEALIIDAGEYTGMWNDTYKLANRLAIVMSAIEAKEEFQNDFAAKKVSDWTQLYGEVTAMRALAYYELVHYYGDIPYFEGPIYTQEQMDGAACMSRFAIYDKILATLQSVEPCMNRLGEDGITAERISRTFVQGLIGRIALSAAGYSTVRTDFTYVDGEGNPVELETKGIEKWNSKYARPTTYRKYIELAEKYLADCVANSGSAQLLVNDERGYGNPFQRHFQYMMDLQVSPESVFEVATIQGGRDVERPYAFGRPSGGGSANAYPCKSYGQSRFYPTFYYGDYDPEDLRRDVTITVTSNSGACSETLISFIPGSREKGGLVNNKWDESRMPNPWITAQRQSGINAPYMRMADVILMLAESYAELGKESEAKAELKKVRTRAFPLEAQGIKVDQYVDRLSGDALKEAIAQERKLEFAGEGLRRFDLIRTGKFPEKIKLIRDQQKAMIQGLETNGYYRFDNGNEISNYIWIKFVNTSDYGMDYMLTKQCDVTELDPAFPVKYPSWRGNHDGWDGFSNTEGNRNLAIQGLFHYIDPNGEEAKRLEEDGYVKTDWAINIVNNKAEYTDFVFAGYPDEYYEQGVPPRYIIPMSSTTIKQSNGLISNGYGYAQE